MGANDIPSPTVRHNPCSDPPCQHGTSKRLVGEGLPFRGDEKIRAVLERVAQSTERELWPHGSGAFNAKERIGDALRRDLLPLLLAGQAMRDSDACAPDFEKEWDAALAAAQGQPEPRS